MWGQSTGILRALWCEEERQQHSTLSLYSQHYNKVEIEGSEIEVSDDLLANDGANLKSELHLDMKEYQKNFMIGKQIINLM